jgi:hypothetical protein
MNREYDAGPFENDRLTEQEVDDMEAHDGEPMGDEVDMESVSSHPKPSLLSRTIPVLLAVLRTNLVWYVAGLVDGLILLKLFGG